MKKLALVMAVAFTLGLATSTLSMAAPKDDNKKAKTECCSKDKKECCKEKKETCKQECKAESKKK